MRIVLIIALHLKGHIIQSFEVDKSEFIIEPRDSIKGDIARSLLYMNAEYGVKLKGMLLMLKEWSRLDPPDEHEIWRNERINQLQGTRNKFIDDYIYTK